jgi:hypothetical protein
MKLARGTAGIVLAAALAALTLAGCRQKKDGDTIVSGNGIFTTDDFPGAPVQDSNLAQDQRAMSPDRESVVAAFTFQNGQSGRALMAWLSASDGGVAPFHLYCAYYNGNQWMPPVSLLAEDITFSAPIAALRVAFVNTAEHASGAARERDGDAIIIWGGLDTDDDGASTADGANTVLLSTYFNVTECENAAANYGYQKFATRVSSLDAAGENLATVAVVTDGLCGEGRFGSTGTYRYGDASTGIVVAWTQAEDNDATNPAIEDVSLWYAWYDLASPGDSELPLVPSADSRIGVIGFLASDSGLDSEETLVDDYMVAYNNNLFFRVASRDSLSGDTVGNNSPAGGLTTPYGLPMAAVGDDVTLEGVAFDLATGTVSSPVSLSSATKSSDLLNTTGSNMAFLRENMDGLALSGETTSVYGSDEGLAGLEIFFVELAADPDVVSDFGDVIVDSEVRMAQLNEATGAIDSYSVVSPGDPSISDNVNQGDVSVRISRNGDYIWLAWLQADVRGTFDDIGVQAAQFTTTRPEDDGSFVLPAASSALSGALYVSPDLDGSGATWIQWQSALGYICGVQSDPDMMSLAFQQSTGSNDQIFIARLVADLAPSPIPGGTVGLFETFTEGTQTDLYTVNVNNVSFIFADAGSDGDIVAAYISDVDPTSGLDFRILARRNGTGAGVVEIDSTTSIRQTPPQSLRIAVTPPGTDIGRFDLSSGSDSSDRPHAAQHVHFLFRESNSTEDSGNGLALRTRRYHAGDGSVSFTESFTPSVGGTFAEPFQLCLPFVDPSSSGDANLVGIGISGDRVGVWFQELGHAYYQECTDPGDDDDTGWRVADGVSDPALIDDDSETELSNTPVLTVMTCGCDTLSHAVLTWLKVFDVLRPNKRLQVRVRDAE